MLYIKCTENYLEYFDKDSNFPDFVKKIIFLYKKIFGKIVKLKNELGEVWLIPENNIKFKKKLIKELNIYQVKTFVLSNNLGNLKSELEALKFNVLNGKWLYRHIIKNIVNFICESKEENIEEQSIAVMIKNPREIDFENLKNLALQCKSINLITKDDFRFKRLENNLYDENGIVLNIAYNYKKSLLKSDIIINIDFDEKEFNKFAIPRKATIINIENIEIYSKGFNGINILDYEIEFPKQYNNEMIDDFDKEILYESIIYKNTAPKNILNRIKHDEMKIVQLVGKNGFINKKEFLKV